MTEFMRRIISRLEPIIDVQILEPKESIVREVSLLKTRRLTEVEMSNVIKRVQSAGGRILELKDGAIIAEVSGDHEEVEQLISSLGNDILKEVARSGQVYISKEI